MSRKLVECGCGCRKKSYFNRMVLVELLGATDDTLRETKVIKRFHVLQECKEDFENELALMQVLQVIVRRGIQKPWWRRISQARQVLRIQHSIFVRNKGFDFARQHATRSMILFVAPAPLAKFLHRKFAKDLNKEHAAITPTAVEAEA